MLFEQDFQSCLNKTEIPFRSVTASNKCDSWNLCNSKNFKFFAIFAILPIYKFLKDFHIFRKFVLWKLFIFEIFLKICNFYNFGIFSIISDVLLNYKDLCKFIQVHTNLPNYMQQASVEQKSATSVSWTIFLEQASVECSRRY